jgi:Fe-S cluster assembly iron-binding protein IscA
MNCVISDQAAVRLKEILGQQEDKSLKIRIVVESDNYDARYGLGLDEQRKNDEVITTNAGIDVLMEKKVKFLDNLEIDYNKTEDKWIVTKRMQTTF